MLTFVATGLSTSPIFSLSSAGARVVNPLIPRGRYSAFSPDGRWIAYTSMQPGPHTDTFVEPFPRRPGVQFQISTDGGLFPMWSPDGTQLYYWDIRNAQLVVVDVGTQPHFGNVTPVAVPIDAIFSRTEARNFDIRRDGKLVVVTAATTAGGSNPSFVQQIDLVLNWFEDLKARVPVK